MYFIIYVITKKRYFALKYNPVELSMKLKSEFEWYFNYRDKHEINSNLITL